MTYLVPFDGSPLSKAALARASVYAVAINKAPSGIRDELLRDVPVEVEALSIIPESTQYARQKGWISEEETFDLRKVVGELHRQVIEIDPATNFEYVRVDSGATAGTISNRIRKRAQADDVSVVFVGSENAGRIITPITSVAGGVTAAMDYDLHIVRRALPPEAKARLRSEFFLVD